MGITSVKSDSRISRLVQHKKPVKFHFFSPRLAHCMANFWRHAIIRAQILLPPVPRDGKPKKNGIVTELVPTR